MTSRSISKGKNSRLPNINRDSRQLLTFLSLTLLRFPVQPGGEGALGESYGILPCSLRFV